MNVTALYPVTMSRDPAATAAFYRELLDLHETFVSNWYVSLASDSGAEIATVQRDHPTIPDGFRTAPGGVLVTVEVDDATAAHARAVAMDAPLQMPLRDEPFGQRHFMVRDPDGLLVDVVQPIAPSAEFASQYRADALPT